MREVATCVYTSAMYNRHGRTLAKHIQVLMSEGGLALARTKAAGIGPRPATYLETQECDGVAADAGQPEKRYPGN